MRVRGNLFRNAQTCLLDNPVLMQDVGQLRKIGDIPTYRGPKPPQLTSNSHKRYTAHPVYHRKRVFWRHRLRRWPENYHPVRYRMGGVGFGNGRAACIFLLQEKLSVAGNAVRTMSGKMGR